MKTASLYIDQYGNRWYANSKQELRKQIANGKSKAEPMYVKQDGRTVQVGYVIADH